VIDIPRKLARTETLKRLTLFLHSFVPTFLISPPGVTSPQGGSCDRGLRRGYFTRSAKRISAKRRQRERERERERECVWVRVAFGNFFARVTVAK